MNPLVADDLVNILGKYLRYKVFMETIYIIYDYISR